MDIVDLAPASKVAELVLEQPIVEHLEIEPHLDRHQTFNFEPLKLDRPLDDEVWVVPPYAFGQCILGDHLVDIRL